MSAEGWLHLFDLTSTKALDASGHHETLGEEQRPVFKQHIPANTKVMLISDIGGHEQPRSRDRGGSGSQGTGASGNSGRPQGTVLRRVGSVVYMCCVFTCSL